MIGIATVVTLWDNNCIIHMLARKIPLLTMKSKVYDLAILVGGIPSSFPSILTHDIMIDSRSLKWSPHVILMDALLEFLHDLQIQHKLILNVL
jgi:hypothetical protein